LVRIFNHGFTTKKNGHGFGLHSGALTAKEIGGTLTVSSEGTGKGSKFTLELPTSTENYLTPLENHCLCQPEETEKSKPQITQIFAED
jgi:hypothetical protein